MVNFSVDFHHSAGNFLFELFELFQLCELGEKCFEMFRKIAKQKIQTLVDVLRQTSGSSQLSEPELFQ